MGSVDDVQFLFKCYNNSFRVTVNAFWLWLKQNWDFQFLAFPVDYVGGLRWRWGLKTNFKICLKEIFVQDWSSGTRFDHGQFEIKSFPIYAHPNVQGFVPKCQTTTLFLSMQTNKQTNKQKPRLKEVCWMQIRMMQDCDCCTFQDFGQKNALYHREIASLFAEKCVHGTVWASKYFFR